MYLSVLKHLDLLIEPVETVFVLSNLRSVAEKLGRKFGGKNFIHLDVDAGKSGGSGADGLEFLTSVHSALPSDMGGALALVGAGIWAEIYCTWIRDRGGVAVDVGSGMDLLDGKMVRPVHGKIGVDRLREFAL